MSIARSSLLLTCLIAACGGPRFIRYPAPPAASAAPHLAVPSSHGDDILSFAFGAGGRLFATGGSGGTLRLWDTSTGVELRSFVLPAGRVSAIAISADGRRIAAEVGGGTHVFDVASGAPVSSLVFDGVGEPRAIALDSAGERIARPEYPGVELFDVATGKSIGVFGSEEHWINDYWDLELAFVDGDTKVAAWGSTELVLVELASGRLETSVAPDALTTVRLDTGGLFLGGLSPRGEAWSGLVSRTKLQAGLRGGATVLDVALPSELQVKDTNVFTTPTADGRAVIAWVASSSLFVVDTSGTRRLASAVRSAKLSPASDLVAAQQQDSGEIFVFDVATGAERFRVRKSAGYAHVRFSADSQSLLSTDSTGTRAWELSRGGHHTVRAGAYPQLLVGAPWTLEQQRGAVVLTHLESGRRLEVRVPDDERAHSAEVDEARGRVVLGLTSAVAAFDLSGRELWRHAVPYIPDELRLSEDGASVAVSRWDGPMHLDASTGVVLDEHTLPFATYPHGLSRDGKMGIWDEFLGGTHVVETATGHTLVELDGALEDISAATFSHDGKTVFLASSAAREIGVVDVASGAVTRTLELRAGRIEALATSPDGRWLAATGADGATHLVDLTRARELITLVTLGEKEWVAATPDGRFDGSPAATAKVAWVSGERVIRLDGTFERYFTPRLLALATGGTAEAAERAFAELPSFAAAPEVRITAPASGDVIRGDTVEVRVFARDLGGGIDELRVRLNGKVISGDERGLRRAGEEQRFTVALAPGENTIEATGFSKDRTESSPARVIVRREAPQATARLFVLAVGIDDYLNPKLRLNYGRGDAEAVVKVLRAKAATIFSSVEVELVIDRSATREAIEAAFARIAKSARAEDAFVFFYAGHGVMSEGAGGRGDFFLVPADVLQLYGQDEVLAAKGLAAERMRALVTSIAAQKQLILLDACQSGGAVERFAMRGAAEEKAIAQLARSAGIAVLAASGTEQFATEVKDLGHGVFTYALLEALEGAADAAGRGDGKVTIKELEAFLSDRVPELTAKHRGERQYPNSYSRGQDFPLGVVR